MNSQDQLDLMDDPLSFIDRRLLAPDAIIRSADAHPLRDIGQDFTTYNNNSGRAIVRGADEYQRSNPRVYGKLKYLVSILI